MSGSRNHNWREGDRSEYLAVYILSALGLVTSVPRQEDIGFDLVCSLAEQEKGRLTFDHEFLVSVKSLSTPTVKLEPTGTRQKGQKNLPHLDWLYRLQLPMLLCVIDKKNQEARIFSTLPAWWVRYSHFKTCGEMTLQPRLKASNTRGWQKPKRAGKLKAKGYKGRYHFIVDLGHPILRIKVSELADGAVRKAAKAQLREAVELGRFAVMQARLGSPYFLWFCTTNPDGKNASAAFYAGRIPAAPKSKQDALAKMAPTLASLALRFISDNDKNNIKAVAQLIKSVPKEALPKALREHLERQPNWPLKWSK